MANTRKRSLVAISVALVLSSAAVAGATTRSSTTTVGAQEYGSTSVRCPKGQTAVAANVVGEASSGGPRVEVDTLARTGKRTVTTQAYNSGGPGKLTAIARCETGPESAPVSATAPVPAETITGDGEATATAQCPPGKRIVFGGFRAKPDADAPGYVVIEVTSATRASGQRWRVHALNVFPDAAGTVEALAYCGKVDSAKARTGTVALGQFETGTAQATCPRGTQVGFGGFKKQAGTPGQVNMNAIESSGGRSLRVTGTERFYLSPGDTTGLTAIAYCR
jgi:hypothetical protein